MAILRVEFCHVVAQIQNDKSPSPSVGLPNNANPNEFHMSFFSAITVDQIVMSFMACYIVREVMVLALPDSIAGPGGWLVNTHS